MGWLSKTWKKIKRGAKRLWEGAKKLVKKVVQSKVFKVALAAVAVYFGGVALGFWGQAAQAGTWTASVAQWGQSTGLAKIGTTVKGAFSGGEAVQGVNSATSGVSSVAGPLGKEVAAKTIVTAGEETAKNAGLISRIVGGATKTAGWIGQHPEVAAIGANAIASAFSPDEEDIMGMQQEQWQQRKDWAYGGAGDWNSVQTPKLNNDRRLKNLSTGENVYGSNGIINLNRGQGG